MIDRNNQQPLYLQVKEDLVKKIEDGRFSKRLPPETELAKEYGVARFSVRRAMAELVDEGILTRTPGRGTFIVEQKGHKLRTVHFVTHHPLAGHPYPEPTNFPILHDILAGVSDAAREQGIRFDILPLDYYDRENFAGPLKTLAGGDGLVVLGDAPVTDVAVALGLATVTCYNRPETTRAPHFVTYDYVKAIRMAVRHLFECGARDVAYVNAGPIDQNFGASSKLGLAQETAREFGTRIAPERIIPASADSAAVNLEVQRYLDERDPPDAFFCTTDYVAVGVLNALSRKGITVPAEARVMGYSDFPVARMVSPQLSTVRVPRYEIGLKAVEVLSRVVEGGTGCRPITELLEAELVVRESTCKTKAG